ncbi:MAG TPA: hypothetical protein VN758_03245 [Solirubrobacterales bacterium]|nr:hypothetical protein [Solirubrobacterales bacterium]
MTRGGTRSIAVLAATALVALLLAACGSSDSDSSDSSSTAGSAGTETSASAQDNGSGGGTEGENDAGEVPQKQSDSGNGSGKSSRTGFTAEEVETPLKVSGGGSEQFVVKGGDNSIQEYGEEKDESELQAAAEVVHAFFVARAAGEWEKACSYLSKAMTEQLEQLATSSTGLKNKGCAPFLEAFTSQLSAAEWRETTAVDAGSLRQEDEQAFLIYYGDPDKTVYAMPLKEEEGTFKVGALSGNALG